MIGDELILGEEPELAPGVRGYSVDVDGELYIPLVIAEKPGNGDVGRFLNSLPVDKIVKFPNVLNRRLAGMLHRRGFVTHVEDSELGLVKVWVRKVEHRP
jgi:hypothetical protein